MAQKKPSISPVDIAKWGYKAYDKFGGALGGAGATGGLSSASVAGGAPAGFAGTATGEAFAGAGAAPGIGLGTMAAGAGALAFAAFVGSKIYEGFTNDQPHLNFHGSEIKYGELPGGTGRDDKAYTGTYSNLPNHGGVQSNNGFNYSISSKDFEGASETAGLTRDYLDQAFQQIQANTSVDINQIIPYAFDGADMKGGESPMDMANRVIQEVQNSVSTGQPYKNNGKYITSTEMKNTYDDKFENLQKDVNSGKFQGRDSGDMQEYIDKNTNQIDSKSYSENRDTGTEYNAPVYSDVPTFEGDPNYQPIAFNNQTGSFNPTDGNINPTYNTNTGTINPNTGSGGNVPNQTINQLNDLNTEIKYQHTLADLSGIQLSDQELNILNTQKEIAIDRAITEIEDTFSLEGESMVAQQIQNLGTNALGGTIGREFVKRWQGRESAAKTGALQDIESTYLSARQNQLDQKKQYQTEIWGKQYTADKDTIGFGLDKYKTQGTFDLGWAGLNANVEQAKLNRDLEIRLGNQSTDMYDDANKWGLAGNVAGGIVTSKWFSDAAGDVWDWLT